jgi:hypothetical protein
VDYYQTSQDTMLIIIQKQQDPKHKYFWVRNETHYIMPSYTIVKALTKKSTTLLEMGMTVKTGDVVWNQEKELLVDKDTPGAVPLIYSTNLVNNELVLDNIIDRDKGKGKAKATNDGEEETVKMGKKQYIRGFRKKPLSGPALFINRGYGNTYAFDYVYVDLPAYYGENHINMILPYKDQDPETSKQELEAIMKSFRDDRTKRFIEAFVGNGALSKTELERVLPIYL